MKYDNFNWREDTNCIVKINNGKRFSQKVIAKMDSSIGTRGKEKACFHFYDTNTDHNYEVVVSKEQIMKMYELMTGEK